MLSGTVRHIIVRSTRQRILPSTVSTAQFLTTTSTTVPSKRLFSSYAVVDHANEYEDAISGQHGKQLQLAYQEGEGKDDPPYDPFLIDEVDEYEVDGDEDYDAEEPLQDMDDDDEDGSVMEEEEEVLYNNDGSLIRPKSELVALQAGLPAGGLFAVIDLNGSQQKVSVDDLVIVNKLLPVSKYAVGTTHTLTAEDVLLVGSSHFTLVGMPGISEAKVVVQVEEITRDKTVIVFKKRRRKHSKRKNGFRREVTFLRVIDIQVPEKYQQKFDYRGK